MKQNKKHSIQQPKFKIGEVVILDECALYEAKYKGRKDYKKRIDPIVTHSQCQIKGAFFMPCYHGGHDYDNDLIYSMMEGWVYRLGFPHVVGFEEATRKESCSEKFLIKITGEGNSL